MRRGSVVGPALSLAVGVAAWELFYHEVARDVHDSMSGGAHVAVHGALTLPLAVVAVVVGGILAQRLRHSWRMAREAHAACVAGTFAALLVPAGLAHPVVHRLLSLPLAAEASAHLAHGGPAAPNHAPMLTHALQDALVGLPMAFVIAFVALGLRPGEAGHTRRLTRVWHPTFAALTLVASSLTLATPGVAAGSPAIAPFARPLPLPGTVSGSSVALSATEADVQIFPSGPPTRMWTFNGSFPGPTILATSGQPQEVSVTNDLPTAVGPITVHQHGEHAAPEFDGQPHDHLIDPGASYAYQYGYADGGMGERGRLQWYHDHVMGVTGRNVWMGLAGMVQLRDPTEAAIDAALPSGDRDVPLLVADRSFDADNQLIYSFNNDGVLGDRLLVNGAIQPYFEVADTKYRLRILNASNARSYELALSDGRSMTQVATESGLLPEPVVRQTVLLGPAERAEVIVDFSGELGTNVVLQNLNGFGLNMNALMEFRVARDEADTGSIPATLRAAPAFDEPVLATRTWVFGQDPVSAEWTINGHGYSEDIVDAHPKLGTTERWSFVNATEVDHIVHIHDVHSQIVARSPLWADTAGLLGDPGLRESFRIRPHEAVAVVSEFNDHTGRYVLHCHLLEHEDHSMMTQFEVVP